jgi:hypothetical protein
LRCAGLRELQNSLVGERLRANRLGENSSSPSREVPIV